MFKSGLIYSYISSVLMHLQIVMIQVVLAHLDWF